MVPTLAVCPIAFLLYDSFSHIFRCCQTGRYSATRHSTDVAAAVCIRAGCCPNVLGGGCCCGHCNCKCQRLRLDCQHCRHCYCQLGLEHCVGWFVHFQHTHLSDNLLKADHPRALLERHYLVLHLCHALFPAVCLPSPS